MNLTDWNILLIPMGQNGKITKYIHCRLFQVHSLAFKNKLIMKRKLFLSLLCCHEFWNMFCDITYES